MDYNFEEMIDRIKIQKKQKGITNKELAEMSSVPYGTLNKILGSETKEPSINAIIKIATALGVTADYIIYGDEKSPSSNKDDRLSEIVKILEPLSDAELLELEAYIDFLIYKRERELGLR